MLVSSVTITLGLCSEPGHKRFQQFKLCSMNVLHKMVFFTLDTAWDFFSLAAVLFLVIIYLF